MSSLYVYHQSSPEQPYKVLTHAEDIASTLAEQGVGFDRWQNATPVAPGTPEEDVINTCKAQIDALMTEGGHVTIQVISVNSSHPQKNELRARYRNEQVHPADELRAFVAGRGLLMLHIGEYVYAVLCEKNDRIAIPAGTRHWFDLGENPQLVAIRLFNKPEGAVAALTGENLASQFPELDDF
jgi:1,2-dihydroxy-3-keto-5-methylthiopentene dioxygenase